MDNKPRMVLHICCAPDEAWVVKSLHDEYELHCYFCNPNIFPPEEHLKRLREAERVAELFGVPFTRADDEPIEWHTATAPFHQTPEGAERCEACFLMRLRKTARFCSRLGWAHFTTVMSVSPYKKVSMLARAGNIAAKEYGVLYVPCDFKKKDGFLNSVRLSRELGIYRQEYCGCYLSKREHEIRTARKTHNDLPTR